MLLGKLATSELGAMPVTEPEIHPATRNPWNTACSAGGSSGGSGAAVAGGLLPIAPGTDGAGSIRIPAAFCGLVGLKPSRGRVLSGFTTDDTEAIFTDGPMARTVTDAAALLDVLAGLTVGKPHWAPPPPRPFLELCRDAPRHLRIRLMLETPVCPVDPELAEATRQTARLLERLGHRVDEVKPFAAAIGEFLPVWQHLMGATPLVRWSKTHPVTHWLGDHGRRLKKHAVLELQHQLAARVLSWFEGADLVLTPTTPVAAPLVSAFEGHDPKSVFYSAAPLGAFTAAFNLTGQPAVSVPAGLTTGGLPMGVQLVGQPFGDATVLAVARQLEDAQPWAQRVPPLSRRAVG